MSTPVLHDWCNKGCGNAQPVQQTLWYQVHVFHMEMTCEGCAGAAKRVLGKLDGVSDIVTDVEKKKVVVTSALPADTLLEALKKAGKECSYVGTQCLLAVSMCRQEGKPCKGEIQVQWSGKYTHNDQEKQMHL